jgi:putative phosphoesterase
VRAAIIADTHLPRGRRALPAGCIERLRSVDLIIHAGDFTAMSVLEQLREYGELIAVHGNVDDPDLQAELPAQTELELGGLRIGVIHDAGRRAARLQRLRARFPAADAVVFGHSHLPLREVAADGFQIFNPGSPTDRRRAPRHTMGIASARRGQLRFELIELD